MVVVVGATITSGVDVLLSWLANQIDHRQSMKMTAPKGLVWSEP
mgnify:CR=1 FL=1